MAQAFDIEPDDIKNIPTYRAAYSDRTALLMAKLARRAYHPFHTDDNAFTAFGSEFSGIGLNECVRLVDNKVGTAGFVVAGPDLIIVVFRGTENMLDWRTNLRVKLVELQGGVLVHRGFYGAYAPIKKAMFDTVRAMLKAKLRPVYITGHSLGGALAVMATSELANDEEADVRDCIAACYTFGCPKAGDRTFDQYVKVPLYRITNGVDLVPAVPPILSGYKHVGDTRYFGGIGIPPLRRPPSIVMKFIGTMRGLIELIKTKQLLNISDHSMNVYVNKLTEWARLQAAEALERRKKTADPTT